MLQALQYRIWGRLNLINNSEYIEILSFALLLSSTSVARMDGIVTEEVDNGVILAGD